MEEFLFSWERPTKQKLSTSMWTEAEIICQQCSFLPVQWRAAPSSSLPQEANSYLSCSQGRSALHTHTRMHAHMWTDGYTTEGNVLSSPSGAKPDSIENASIRASPISGMRNFWHCQNKRLHISNKLPPLYSFPWVVSLCKGLSACIWWAATEKTSLLKSYDCEPHLWNCWSNERQLYRLPQHHTDSVFKDNLKSQCKGNSDCPTGVREHSPGLSLQLTSMAGFHSPFLQVKYL